MQVGLYLLLVSTIELAAQNPEWINYTLFNSGLPGNYVNSIAIDNSGNDWVGTWDGGLAVFHEGDIASIEQNEVEVEFDDYYLQQNYPNPFNPVICITHLLHRSNFVKLKIHDLLGRKVKTLVSEFQNAGDYSISFHCSQLSSGVYFYQFKAGNEFVATKKMVVVR